MGSSTASPSDEDPQGSAALVRQLSRRNIPGQDQLGLCCPAAVQN
jgi:hypothetical protein